MSACLPRLSSLKLQVGQMSSVGIIDASSREDAKSSQRKKVYTEVDTDPVIERLFNNEKKTKVVRTADDALLSTLPTPTLKHIKARRKLNCFDKVPLTYYRERQLRSIFRGLDFDGMGDIHLDLVKEAADYAEEKLKPKRGEPVFVNVRGMFEAMDEDGDGTVDFHEFTIAMTGSSTSTMDKASEHDVERLTARFLEFANIKKRERAVAEIHDDSSAQETVEKGVPTFAEIRHHESRMHPIAKEIMLKEADYLNLSKISYDAHKLDSFRACFSVFNKNVSTEDVIAEAKAREEARKKSRAPQKERKKEKTYDDEIPNFTDEVSKTQEILDIHLNDTKGFHYSAKSHHTEEEKQAKQEEFMKIQSREKSRRLFLAAEFQKDVDITEGRRRELAEQKYIASFNRVKKPTISELARRKRKPTLLPLDPYPVKNGLKMQIEARKDIAALKESLRNQRKGSDASECSSVKTGSSGGLTRFR